MFLVLVISLLVCILQPSLAEGKILTHKRFHSNYFLYKSKQTAKRIKHSSNIINPD